MAERPRAARRGLAAAAFVAFATFGLTSASAVPGRTVVYDALGDSYASGYGVPPYSACGRSAAAYPVQVAGRERLALDDFVACAGATTATLVSGGQLAALDARTDLVTLTIGGNDTGWSGTVAACLGGTDAACARAIELSRARVTDVLPGLLDSVYAQVRARAPRARVLVTGYPRLFAPQRGPFLLASPAEQQAMNDGADLLDRVIAAAAARHGFGFVGVTRRFDGHAANAADPWITGAFSSAPFHPNVQGYRAYTAALTAAVRPSELP